MITQADDIPTLQDRLLAHAPAAVATLDHQGRVLNLSASFTRIFGYTIEDIPHIDAWWSLAYPDPVYREDRRTAWMALMQGVFAEGSEIHNFEGRVHCKGGNDIWVDAHASSSATEFFILLVDISARKGLEDERRQSEWLELALASTDSGIWEWQPDTDSHYWSKNAYRLFGLDGEPPGFKQWEQYVHPDDRDATVSAILHAVERGERFEAEYRMLQEDGVARWILVRGKPVVVDGLPLRYLGIVLDVTRQREERDRMRVLSQIFQQSPNAIIVTDPRMVITHVNPSFSRILGYAGDEVVGRPANMLGGETTPPETLQALTRAVAAGEAWEGDFHNRRKDGTVGIDQCRVFPVRDAAGCLTHFVGIQVDVTEARSQAQELDRYRRNLEALVEQRTGELRAAEQKYRTIADHTYDWETWIDPSGDYLYCSPSCLRITGHPPSDFMADPDLMLRIAHPDDAERVRAHYAEHDGGDCGERQMEFRIIDAAGQEHWLEHLCRPVRDDAGRPLGFRGSNRDITERKAIEAERESARQAAERLARMKSDFLANMSHEIRTPLNGVLGLAQVGYRQSAGRGDASETFGRILEAGQQLMAVINDILDFSKIEAGKLAIESVPFVPGELLQQGIDSVAEAARTKGLALHCEVAPDLPRACLGDPVRIKQVLLNLLANAVKFSEAGDIHVAAHREDDQLVFSVADTGIGIAPEMLERLFLPFEQADSSTTRRHGGTGLGLAISRRLSALMGGSLRVDSRPSAGSRFELLLPCREIDPQADSARQGGLQVRSSAQRLAGLRILVAEDNEVSRLVLNAMLEMEGARVTLAENGRLAVEAVAAAPAEFDLVLMDVQMPEMDGRAATREIHQRVPGLPVIGQTAHVLAAELRQCLDAGMVSTIGKPIGQEELVQVVQRTLSTGAAMRADAAAPRPAPSATLVDWNRLHARHAEMPELVGRLIAVALDGQGQTAERLRQAADGGDFDALYQIAHGLKGTAGHFCADALGDTARAAEAAARACDPAIVALADTLVAQVDTFVDELRRHAGSPQKSALTGRHS